MSREELERVAESMVDHMTLKDLQKIAYETSLANLLQCESNEVDSLQEQYLGEHNEQ